MALLAQGSGGAPRKLRKILSLDGGGVRGLSTVVLLGEVMAQLNFDREQKVDPWQEFDMIGGTSTGGLIAIMLGRLHMSIKECEAAYCKFSEEIFQPRRDPIDPRRLLDFVNARGKFDANSLKNLVKETVREAQYDQEELLKDTRPDACKVLVSVIRGDDSSATVLRSYVSRQPGAARLIDECTIWQAARATSAASTFFDPIEIGPHGQIFVDGGLRNNNPINQVYEEARAIWPNDALAILSIGTGDAPGQTLEGNLKTVVERIKDMSLDAKATSDTFIKNHPEMYSGNRLFRMNVPGLASIGLEEYKQRRVIVSRTETYIEDPATQRIFNPCVESFTAQGPRVTGNTQDSKSQSYLRHHTFETSTATFPGRPQNAVGYCAKCFRVFTDGSVVHLCTLCEFELCDICQLSHQFHQRATVTKTYHAITWNSSLLASEAPRCDVCTRPVLIGTTCKRCNISVCNNCKRNNTTLKLWVTEHHDANPTHKFYEAYEIAVDCPNTIPNVQCPCHGQTHVVVHCAACSRPIPINEWSYICSTCLITFGGSHRLCGGCTEKMTPKHRQLHNIEAIVAELDPAPSQGDEEEPIRDSFLCLECNTSFESDIRPSIVHPTSGPGGHYRFKQYYTPQHLENAHINGTRNCPRRGLRIDQPRKVTKAIINDCVCKEPIAAGQVGSKCFTYGCGYYYCSLCTQQNRQFHRHPLTRVRYMQLAVDEDMSINCWMCKKDYYNDKIDGCVKCPKCADFVCPACFWRKMNSEEGNQRLCSCRVPPEEPARWDYAQKTTSKETFLPKALSAIPPPTPPPPSQPPPPYSRT